MAPFELHPYNAFKCRMTHSTHCYACKFCLLKVRPKAERIHRQLAEIFHIEQPGLTRPDPTVTLFRSS